MVIRSFDQHDPWGPRKKYFNEKVITKRKEKTMGLGPFRPPYRHKTWWAILTPPRVVPLSKNPVGNRVKGRRGLPENFFVTFFATILRSCNRIFIYKIAFLGSLLFQRFSSSNNFHKVIYGRNSGGFTMIVSVWGRRRGP